MPHDKFKLLCFDETDYEGIYEDIQEEYPALIVQHVMTADEGFERLCSKDYDFVTTKILIDPVCGLEIANIIKRNPKIFGTPAVAVLSDLDVPKLEKYITKTLNTHFINAVDRTFEEIYAEFDGFITAYILELQFKHLIMGG